MFAGFFFTASRLVWDPFSELTPKWGPQLSAVFILSSLVSNWMSLSPRVRPPTKSFFCFLSRIHSLMAFSFEFPSTNQNLLSISCWRISLFNSRVPNYFTILGQIKTLAKFFNSGVNIYSKIGLYFLNNLNYFDMSNNLTTILSKISLSFHQILTIFCGKLQQTVLDGTVYNLNWVLNDIVFASLSSS